MNASAFLLANAWQRLAATPVSYLLLWAGLVALAVGCVVLYRTQWGQSKPLRKCAVLSLLVHVLLAGLAMTVKIVVGDGGAAGGGGGPIRVRIVDAEGTGPSATAKAASIVETTVSEIPETVLLPETTDIVAQEMPTAPTLFEQKPQPAEPAKVTVEPTTAPTTPTESNSVLVENVANDAQPSRNVERPVSQPLPTNQIATTQNSPAGAESTPSNGSTNGDGKPAPAGDPYAGRAAGDRLGLVEGQGGSRQTEAAVVGGLTWLASTQSPDGHWSAARYGAGVERKILGEDRQGAGRDADTGVTALALLAFLGAGHSHVAGDYQPAVEHGLAYLLRTQAADGSLFGGAGLYSQMYCHSMATFALAEAQAMTHDQRLEPAVVKALGYSVRAQDPVTGGWRYRPMDSGDTSQLGWQVMALASGERAGLSMPQKSWSGIDRFLRSVRRGSAGGLASYRPDSRQSTSMTAEALYCRLVLTDQAGGTVDERAAMEATRQILSELPAAGKVNLYYWYYATLALHHRRNANEEAAAAWRTWNEALTGVLVAGQEPGGALTGSWTPDVMWGGHGGRIYSTALSAMCLEVYYRYTVPAPTGRTEMVARPEYQTPTR